MLAQGTRAVPLSAISLFTLGLPALYKRPSRRLSGLYNPEDKSYKPDSGFVAILRTTRLVRFDGKTPLWFVQSGGQIVQTRHRFCQPFVQVGRVRFDNKILLWFVQSRGQIVQTRERSGAISYKPVSWNLRDGPRGRPWGTSTWMTLGPDLGATGTLGPDLGNRPCRPVSSGDLSPGGTNRGQIRQHPTHAGPCTIL